MEEARGTHLPHGSQSPRPRPSPADILRGLVAHTDERYQTLSIEVGRIESAVRRLAEVTKEAFRRAAGGGPDPEVLEEQSRRLEKAVSDLSSRIETLTDSLERDSVHAYLTDFTEHTQQGLAQVADRVRDGFVALADRAADANAPVLSRLDAMAESAHADPPVDRSPEIIDAVHRMIAETSSRIEDSIAGVEEQLRAMAEEQLRGMAEQPISIEGGLETRIERLLRETAERQQALLENGVAARVERALRKAEERYLAFEEVVEARIERGFRKTEERLIVFEDELREQPPESPRKPSRPVSPVRRDPKSDDPFARLPVRFGDDPVPRRAEG